MIIYKTSEWEEEEEVKVVREYGLVFMVLKLS